MKYIVERASTPCWDEEEEKPCEEARRELILCVDERSVDDPAKIPALSKDPQKWYNEAGYFNHRVENGHIKRDHYRNGWVIEIPTLEKLHEFISKYGSVVIDPPLKFGETLPTLKIYDDFIE